MPQVLITDGLLRKALAATRSLGSRGVRVIVSECDKPNPAAWSRYASGTRLYPDPVHSPEQFMQWLLNELETSHYDVFMPMDDATMTAAVRWQKDLRVLTHLLVPPEPIYHRLRDKWEAVQLAGEFGFSCPDAFLPHDDSQWPLSADRLHYPMVIKPRHSSGSRGLRVAKSSEELIRHYADIQETWPDPMVQAYVEPGERIDVCLLCDRNSDVVASFVQKELRHFPLPYGPSTAQESIHEDGLVAQCAMFARAVGWVGVMEFEFMRDAVSGVLQFMEINTRFWNSLQLSISSGIDFPWLLYRLSLGDVVRPTHAYPSGIRCRSILPIDSLHYLQNPDRRHMQPSFWSRRAVGGQDDILSLDDPGAALGFLASLARHSLEPSMWRLMFRR